MKSKRIRTLLGLLLATAILLGAVTFPALGATTEEQIAALREKSKSLQSQIDEAEEKMAALKDDIAVK